MTKPIVPIKPVPLPKNMHAYSAGGSWNYIDRAGVLYQQTVGRINDGTPWGIHIWRTPAGRPSELLFLVPDANGGLYIANRKLYLAWTDLNGQQWYQEMPGFIYWDDTPSANVVDVNEAQVAVLKAEIDVIRNLANDASIKASRNANDIYGLQKQVNALSDQIKQLQQTILSRQQIEDIVWSKIKDMNYIYRMAFLAWPRATGDADVDSYVNDLVSLMRKVKNGVTR